MLSKFKKGYPAAKIIHEQPEICRYRRELPPADYSVKIESFSSVKEKGEKFESDAFEAQGHRWRLCFYPNGNKDEDLRPKKKEKSYNNISLYLNIVDTDAYPSSWQVHVNFKLFIFDAKHCNYLTTQDADSVVKCFDGKNTELGFPQFISHEELCNSSNGFLINDTCVLGAEVFVVYPSMVGKLTKYWYPAESTNIFTWDIKNFSKRVDWYYIQSEMFIVDERAWTFCVYPKGSGSVSLCLFLHKTQDLPAETEISVKYKMRILNTNNNNNNLERASSGLRHLTKGESIYENNMINFEDLQQASNGYIKNDTLTVQVIVFVLI